MLSKFKLFFILCVFFKTKITDSSSSSIKKTVDFKFKVSEIHDLIANSGWNCTDVIKYFIDRSVKYNTLLHAIISYNPNALKEANELDEYYFLNKKKFIGQLHCIPILAKDIIDVKVILALNFGDIKA